MQFISFVTNAKKKMDKTLDDFNRALPALKGAGFTVNRFTVKMGILPSILTTLRGSLDAIDPVKIKHLRETHQDNKIMVSVLRALETSSNIKGLVPGMEVRGIEVKLKVGIIPDVEVGFLQAGEPNKAMLVGDPDQPKSED